MNLFQTYHSDEILMAQLQQGDSHAMNLLYERYSRPLLAFFRRMLGGDRELAEDMLQETFLRLIDRANLYINNKKFTTWLYCIAYNLCKNEYRRRVRSRVDAGEGLPSSTPDPDSHSFDLQDEVSQKLFTEALFQELEKLGSEKKSLFLLRHQQDLPIREIAQITGLAEGTVKSRLFTISRILAERLVHFHPYSIKD